MKYFVPIVLLLIGACMAIPIPEVNAEEGVSARINDMHKVKVMLTFITKDCIFTNRCPIY